MKLRRSYKAVICAVFLMLAIAFFQSCTTTKVIAQNPTINFPRFPNIDGVEFDEKTGVVLVPLDCWVRITEYAVDIEAIKKTLDEWQKIDKGDE